MTDGTVGSITTNWVDNGGAEMRKTVPSTLLAAIIVMALSTPAQAGRAAAAYASITSVQPQFVAAGEDACGAYCEYRAAVTMSWNGTIRLWVSHVVDGVRHAPGEVRLTGSGKNVTVVVPGIRVEAGATGYLVAEAQVLSKRTWTIFDTESSPYPVTCSAPS